MECEFSVELGADDPTLAVPWSSPDGSHLYVDLHLHPEEIPGLSEVKHFPELGDFLRALNAGPLATAKCDAWFDTLMDVDDEPYQAKVKCACYVDVFFAERHQFAGFAQQERAARALVQRLRGSADLAARALVALRRAYFHEHEGFYWTLYVFGYGTETEGARRMWRNALALVRDVVASAPLEAQGRPWENF